VAISNQALPGERDSELSSQISELLSFGLDSALKLSLLSEAWIFSKHGNCGGTVSDYAVRLGYSDDLVRQELDQLAQSGYFKRSSENDLTVLYFLTKDAPRLQTVRRLLSSWRDIRFDLRATAMLKFGQPPGLRSDM